MRELSRGIVVRDAIDTTIPSITSLTAKCEVEFAGNEFQSSVSWGSGVCL